MAPGAVARGASGPVAGRGPETYNAGQAPRRLHTFRFDRFTLEPGTRRLLDGGAEVHLSPKAFDLLLCLVEHHDRAVARAELQERLWPSTFVLDTNLASLVAEIRRALGDDADEPRFVRTVHRFGYWFVGALEGGASRPATPPARVWLLWETRQIALGEGEHVLGRSPDVEVWIDAAGVSRHHARLVIDAEGASVEDLGSKNGSFLRGTQLSGRQPVGDGDQIRLGSVVLTIRIPPAPGTTETMPPPRDAPGGGPARRAT